MVAVRDVFIVMGPVESIVNPRAVFAYIDGAVFTEEAQRFPVRLAALLPSLPVVVGREEFRFKLLNLAARGELVMREGGALAVLRRTLFTEEHRAMAAVLEWLGFFVTFAALRYASGL